MGALVCRVDTVTDKETTRNTLRNRESFRGDPIDDEDGSSDPIDDEDEKNFISLILREDGFTRPKSRPSFVKFADFEDFRSTKYGNGPCVWTV